MKEKKSFDLFRILKIMRLSCSLNNRFMNNMMCITALLVFVMCILCVIDTCNFRIFDKQSINEINSLQQTTNKSININSSITSLSKQNQLNTNIEHLDIQYIIRPFEETCVCCLTECGDENNGGGARFNIYEMDILHNKLIDALNNPKYGKVKKISKKPHISFEYFCCMNTNDMLIADDFINNIYQWNQHNVTFYNKISVWPRKDPNKSVLFVMEPDKHSQKMLFEMAKKFEIELEKHMQQTKNEPLYKLKFTRSTVFHSSLLWVDPTKYNVYQAIQDINLKFGGALSGAKTIIQKPCHTKEYAKQYGFTCVDPTNNIIKKTYH